ncbi:AraC family transcriptional regulator [Paraburkholderia phymatum]|uniref:Transcriptional regulator, AraC family n=1 Tax=Paraburkholderia phymatum (strain DSM 17167 / CIP 108236 / LMG 21445 / STM815) TaxID=391038 RepID=B2JQM5_PARP8|nr:AraC family transcriptional regulator [Paraburkholderia phymatum]ACC73566.1 transcriptional regulator, AraC family [Paraburkholderia phymatum STM815]
MKSRGRVQMLRCALDGVEATVAHTTHAFARHSHDCFGIGVVIAGGQRSASGRGPVEARATDVITVNPGEVHDGSPLDERGRAWRMLYFAPSLVTATLAECAHSALREVELTRPVLNDPKLSMCLTRVFSVAVHAIDEDVTPDNLACEEALLGLFAHVGRHYATSAPPGPVPNVSVARARSRIDDDPASASTLAELAAEAGMSRFQLLRSFAHEVGLPPHAYRMQRRVALARHLIARGMPLVDAAVSAGFADQSHMTRAFVRLLGVTPASYAAAVR